MDNPKSETASHKSEEPYKISNQITKIRMAELKETIRTQRNQLENLFHEINHLQKKEEKHQQSIEAYDILDRYVKRMTEKNTAVKTFW